MPTLSMVDQRVSADVGLQGPTSRVTTPCVEVWNSGSFEILRLGTKCLSLGAGVTPIPILALLNAEKQRASRNSVKLFPLCNSASKTSCHLSRRDTVGIPDARRSRV